MKFFLALLIGVTLLLSPALSGNCNTYVNALYGINNLMQNEIETHRINMYRVPNSYYDRANHVLMQLNNKISAFGRGTGQCSALENDILARLKEHNIENEGLEDMLTRLRKLFQFYDSRNEQQLDEIRNEKLQQEICANETYTVEQRFDDVNNSKRELANEVKMLKEQIRKLTEEKLKLQARLNNNAPTINVKHGVIQPSCINDIGMESTNHTNEKVPKNDERIVDSNINNSTDVPDGSNDKEDELFTDNSTDIPGSSDNKEGEILINNSTETPSSSDKDILKTYGGTVDSRSSFGSTMVTRSQAAERSTKAKPKL